MLYIQIQGQIVPPKLNDIALNAKLSADASAVFDVKANLDVRNPGRHNPSELSLTRRDTGNHLRVTHHLQHRYPRPGYPRHLQPRPHILHRRKVRRGPEHDSRCYDHDRGELEDCGFPLPAECGEVVGIGLAEE